MNGMNKGRELKEMMNNKQLFYILFAGVQNQTSDEALRVRKSERSTIRMGNTA